MVDGMQLMRNVCGLDDVLTQPVEDFARLFRVAALKQPSRSGGGLLGIAHPVFV